MELEPICAYQKVNYLVVVCNHSLECEILTIIHVVTAERSLERNPPSFLLALVLLIGILLEVVIVGNHGETLEEALDLVGVCDYLPLTQLFQGKHSFRGSDKDLKGIQRRTSEVKLTKGYLCLTFAVLLSLDIEGTQDSFGTILERTGPLGPGLLAAHTVSIEELVVHLTVGISCTSDTHVFKQTQILDLMGH